MDLTYQFVIVLLMLGPAVAEAVLSVIFLVKNKGVNEKSANMLTASSLMGLMASIALAFYIFLWQTNFAIVFAILFIIIGAPFTIIGCIRSAKQNPEGPNKTKNLEANSTEDEDIKEILAFKDLFDKGVISKEEFENKKRKILNRE